MQCESQLFCFPYAGGTAVFFDVLQNDVEGIELVRHEYAGHGTRHKEMFHRDFDELADDAFEQLVKKYRGGKYGLFGYSMGSIVLIEVLKRIINSGMEYPTHVFLAAHEPCAKVELLGYTDNATDEWVMDRIIRFGAVPEELLHNKTFWRMYLPIYRADFSLIGKYRFDTLNLRVSVPATVFYSETDTPINNMRAWEKVFVRECSFYMFQGTHFFIQQYHREIGRIIRDRLGVLL